MQDIGDGGGGRFIGVGDRRLRPHSHHQALKCPRCDSLNTKFCYYNNYNLSQPRHFCKSCRRYWTKGGVLRAVPIGGGCRKNKRSNSKAKSEARESKSHARSSSSENSSLTAAAVAATAAGAAAAEEGSAPTSESLVLCNFPDARYSNVNHEPLVYHLATHSQIFSAEMGSLTSLMTSSEEMMGFGVADISYGRDQTVRVAEDPSPATAEEFKIGDWGSGGGDRDLFDLTAEVDPSYWSQTEWNDDDQRV